MSSPHERLKEWFANHYHKEQFRLSMGEVSIEIAGFNTLLGFLAQGVALNAYGEDRYLEQLTLTHEKLRVMIEEQKKIPGHDQSPLYHYPLIIGVLIEMDVQAAVELRTEDERE